jgi:lysophospholipase
MDTAPFYADVAFGPDGGVAHWVTATDGLKIRVANWTNPDAKGTVLIFPGRTEYIEKYGDAAREFLEQGYASVAIDWRGQGLADRMADDRRMGHVGKFTDYQKDVAAVMAHVEGLGLPAPYYLVAHSMGGCIGLRALMEGLPVSAAAFSAPMWGIGLSPVVRPGAWVISSIARTFGKDTVFAPGQPPETYVLREEFDINTLTRDREMWDRLVNQMQTYPDLSLGGPSIRWLGESLREMLHLSSRPSPKTPTVTFLGTAEDIVDPQRIKDRMAKWSNGTLHMIEKAEHEVMHEIPATRAFVFDKMIAHFAAHP